MLQSKIWDFVIIGSGVSGGRISYDLVKQGASVLLIEAGKAFSSKTFPSREIDYSTQMFWGGGMEPSADGSLAFLRAKCLGGTSIVNQALVDRFDELAWNEWYAITGMSLFQTSEMNRWYDEVEKDLPIQTIPKHHQNQNAKLFVKAFDTLGYFWKPLDRAQKDCGIEKGTDCISCLGGCRRNSKQSSLVTSIEPALQMGLEIQTNSEVHEVKDEKTEVKIRGMKDKETFEVRARRVVLAAGALGNTKILLRSRFQKELPSLGTHFSCHPQFMSFGLFDQPVDAHKGAFQSVKSSDPKLRRAGYKFENVFAPPIGTAMLIPGYGNSHTQIMKKYRYLASLEVCIKDEANGFIYLDRRGELVIRKKLSSIDLMRLREANNLVEEIFLTEGAKSYIRGNQGFGLHLMGGCPIGTDSKKSVVNPDFQIHDHPNLYCADSSIFPAAPGINPSFTIMALTRAALHSISRNGK